MAALAGVEAEVAVLATARRDARRALAGLRHRHTRWTREQANALAALDRQLYLALGERRRLRAGCPLLRAGEHRYEVVRR